MHDEFEVCADRDQGWGVLVLEVAPTSCYATQDFDVVVGDSRPACTDYCFEDTQRLEELWGVITSYWIGKNGREDGEDVLMIRKCQTWGNNLEMFDKVDSHFVDYEVEGFQFYLNDL